VCASIEAASEPGRQESRPQRESLGGISRQRAHGTDKDRFIAASLMLRRKAILVWVVFSDCTDVPTSESYTALERLDAEGDGRLEGLEGTLNGIPCR
jgi:hypothetical protein